MVTLLKHVWQNKEGDGAKYVRNNVCDIILTREQDWLVEY